MTSEPTWVQAVLSNVAGVAPLAAEPQRVLAPASRWALAETVAPAAAELASEPQGPRSPVESD